MPSSVLPTFEGRPNLPGGLKMHQMSIVKVPLKDGRQVLRIVVRRHDEHACQGEKRLQIFRCDAVVDSHMGDVQFAQAIDERSRRDLGHILEAAGLGDFNYDCPEEVLVGFVKFAMDDKESFFNGIDQTHVAMGDWGPQRSKNLDLNAGDATLKWLALSNRQASGGQRISGTAFTRSVAGNEAEWVSVEFSKFLELTKELCRDFDGPDL